MKPLTLIAILALMALPACSPPPPVDMSMLGCPPTFNAPRAPQIDEDPRLAFPPSMLGCATRANLIAMLANPGDVNGRNNFPAVEGNRAVDPVARIKRNAPAGGGPISGAPPIALPSTTAAAPSVQ
jgi:hypothetical protein